MTRINLLPWREEQREERKKEFFVALAIVAVVALLLVFLLSLLMQSRIENQMQRNAFLNQKVNDLSVKEKVFRDNKEKREKISARLAALQLLNANRSYIVKVFNALPETVPKDVYLEKMIENSGSVSFEGISKNNRSISQFMQNLEKTSVFSDLKLRYIKNNGTGKNSPSTDAELKKFKINAKILQLNSVEKPDTNTGRPTK